MFKERLIYSKILNHLEKKEYTIITGARQVGKTTILKKLYNDLKIKYKYVYYLSFEDPGILNQINHHPENVFQYSRIPDNPLIEGKSQYEPERIILLIDEIQYAKNPSNFLKYLYDTYNRNLKIIATGSSAFYLDTKFKDSLAGRKKIIILKTLNFTEYLIFNEKHELAEELEQIRNRKEYLSVRYNELLNFFSDYLIFGGYPVVVLEKNKNDKIDYIKELVSAYIKKDIYESKIEDELKFYNLLGLLASQTANIINKNEIANTLMLSQKTVERYIFIMRKCFHIDVLLPFYSNIRKEITKMPKVFFNDLGLRNVLVGNYENINERTDKGQLLENYVFIRLNELYDKGDIKYWRTTQKNEVDFVITETSVTHGNGKGKAIEVKYNANALKLTKFNTFKKFYPGYPLQFICFRSDDLNVALPVLKL